MRGKKMLLLLFLLAALPMFAQTPGGVTINGGELKFLGGVIGMGLASGLCGIGQGKAAAAAAEATARNPGARGTDLDCHDSWSGADRVAGHLHPRDRVERD